MSSLDEEEELPEDDALLELELTGGAEGPGVGDDDGDRLLEGPGTGDEDESDEEMRKLSVSTSPGDCAGAWGGSTGP